MSVLFDKLSRKPIVRRSISISLMLVATVVLCALAPLWILGLGLYDRLGQRSALRCIAFITCFLIMELLGLVALFAVWCARPLMSSAAYGRANFGIQVWWGGTLFACARRLFALDIQVEGQELARQTPHVLLPRHASFGDTVFACALISAPFGVRHRYALKRELLWDPCIDIAGHRLRCIFLERASGRSADEVERLANACAALEPDEGVLIYPEGTRYSAAKRERRLAQLSRGDPPAVPVAKALRHLIYPHMTGTYAVFQGADFPDAVFLAHSGFEHSASFASLWHGRLQGARVTLRFWRVAGASIPRDKQAFADWLVEEWQNMDRQLDAMQAAGAQSGRTSPESYAEPACGANALPSESKP